MDNGGNVCDAIDLLSVVLEHFGSRRRLQFRVPASDFGEINGNCVEQSPDFTASLTETVACPEDRITCIGRFRQKAPCRKLAGDACNIEVLPNVLVVLGVEDSRGTCDVEYLIERSRDWASRRLKISLCVEV